MLYYVTSNQNKIAVAQKNLTPLGVHFEPIYLDIVEIQSDSLESVALQKAQEAFNKVKKPLFINDHFWSISALHGFPGAYMKYMNQWLEPEDFLRLMKGKENRDAIQTEALCFTDGNTTKLFTTVHKGKVLEQKEGEGIPAQTIISLSSDNISIAKKLETDPSAIEEYPLWEEFATWYKKYTEE